MRFTLVISGLFTLEIVNPGLNLHFTQLLIYLGLTTSAEYLAYKHSIKALICSVSVIDWTDATCDVFTQSHIYYTITFCLNKHLRSLF